MSSRYSIVPIVAIQDRNLSPRDITVLCVLGAFADKSGHCYPSVGKIGKMLGITRQAVQKSINNLVSSGYLVKRERKRVNGAQTSNIYHVRMDYVPPESRMRVSENSEQEHATLQPQVAPPATSEVAPPATSEVAPPATSEVAPYYRTSQENVPKERPRKNNARARRAVDKSHNNHAIELPDWLPEDDWNDYVANRRAIKKPMSEIAMRRAIKTLDKLRRSGQDVRAVLDKSIVNGWAGLFPVKNNGGTTAARSSDGGGSTIDSTIAAAEAQAERIRRMLADEKQ